MTDDTERIVTFFYPPSCLGAEGSIYMRTSSYDRTTHYSGTALVTPDHPDYELWLWILPRIESLKHGRVSDKDRETYRLEFEQARLLSGHEDTFREQLFAAVPICPKPTSRQRIEEFVGSILESVTIVFFFAVFAVLAVVTAPFRWGKDFLQRGRVKH